MPRVRLAGKSSQKKPAMARKKEQSPLSVIKTATVLGYVKRALYQNAFGVQSGNFGGGRKTKECFARRFEKSPCGAKKGKKGTGPLKIPSIVLKEREPGGGR